MATHASVTRTRATPFLAAALLLWASLLVLTWVVVSSGLGPTPFDLQWGTTIHDLAVEDPWLIDVALVLRFVGGVPACTVIVAAVAVTVLVTGGARRPWGTHADAAAFLVLCAAGGALVDSLVKQWVGRPRPPWNGLWSLEDSPSFPSGHAQTGITVWVALGIVALVLLNGRARWLVALPLLVLGPVIGMSRTVLGVHWPTDVLGGWALGGAWLFTCAALAVVVTDRAARHRNRLDDS